MRPLGEHFVSRLIYISVIEKCHRTRMGKRVAWAGGSDPFWRSLREAARRPASVLGPRERAPLVREASRRLSTVADIVVFRSRGLRRLHIGKVSHPSSFTIVGSPRRVP